MAESRCLFVFQHAVASPLTCVRHSHPCTEIVFNIGGAGTLYHGDPSNSFAYGPRSVFTYQPGAMHWVTQTRPGVHLCFGMEGCGASNIRVGSFQTDAELVRLQRTAQQALASGLPNKRTRLELIAGMIALHLSERFPLQPSLTLAQRARALLDQNYREPVTMSGVAKQLFISPDYLREIFRAEYGEGPLHYLLRKRIEAATELLRHSALTVQDVARECGFTNPFYFSRLYRKMRGKSPSAEKVRGGRRGRI